MYQKIHNPDFIDIPHIPIEVSVRDKIGIVIPISNIESILKKIEESRIKSELIKKEIKKIRNYTIFNIGKSNKIGAKNIIELLNELKDKRP